MDDLCHGEEHGASQCPLVKLVRCVCGHRWKPESNDPSDPGPCPKCGQYAASPQRCETCPVVEVQYYREETQTGLLLSRIQEHEFDCKHYRVDPGDVSAEVREGLKILESERTRWERETREEKQREWEEKQRVREMQRRGGGF